MLEYYNNIQNLGKLKNIRQRHQKGTKMISHKLGRVHEPIKEYTAIAISISSEEAQLELNSISLTNKFLISLRLKLNLMQN